MEYYRLTNSQAEWLELVLNKAGQKFFYSTFKGSCEIPASNVPDFWNDIPVPPDHRINYPYSDNQIKYLFFRNNLDENLQSQLLSVQQEIFLRISHCILEVKTDVVENLKNIREQFLLSDKQGSKDSKGMLPFVFRHREVFDQNPALHPITRLQSIACDLINAKPNIETKKDLGDFLSAHLRQEYDFDVLPGTIILVVDAFDGDVLADIKAVLAERKKGAPSLIQAQPDFSMKMPLGLAAHFAEETAMPRKQQYTSGGHAGLGRAKPDLWKPNP